MLRADGTFRFVLLPALIEHILFRGDSGIDLDPVSVGAVGVGDGTTGVGDGVGVGFGVGVGEIPDVVNTKSPDELRMPFCPNDVAAKW